MRNKLEHILLSILLGVSVLLGLSFWLNTSFGFNMFSYEHWTELAKLQATNIPINPSFYVYISVSLIIFIIGLVIIYIPKQKTLKKQNTETNIIPPAPVIKISDKKTEIVPEPIMSISRPPRLNLPKNIEHIAQQRQAATIQTTNAMPAPTFNQPQMLQSDKYDNELSQIFSDNGYLVKTAPQISGFTPNLFAIGNSENLWIGGADCKIEDLQKAVEKLQSVFQTTLEDITINIHAFLLDTLNTQKSNDSVLVVHSVDDLNKYLSEHPITPISDEDEDNFNAYSEYIDTIIKYIKNL